MYLNWLKFQAFMKDCGEYLLAFILMIGRFLLGFVFSIFNLVRDIAYLILCVISFVMNFVFLVSLYYGYKVYTSYKGGIAFFDIPNVQVFLCMFFVPIGVYILKEIVRPKN